MRMNIKTAPKKLIVVPFILFLGFAAQATAQDTKLKWFGHAAFSITTPNGKVLLIDPWLKNPSNPEAKDGKDPLAAVKKVDYILLTHGHRDHVGDAVEIARKTKAVLICNPELAANFGLASESLEPSVSATPPVAMMMAPTAWRRLIRSVESSVAGMFCSIQVARHGHFVYNQSMNVENDADAAVSRIAAAIAGPARVRILYCLMDGHARTSTELAIVAEVSPSTASVHLNRLKRERLVKVLVQGKHRLYSLEGPNVARALERLSVLAGASRTKFVASTPSRLLAARTCYDHIAGSLGVSLHDGFKALGWLSAGSTSGHSAYDVTLDGKRAFEALGIDVDATRTLRRRFAYACLDWSERRPHVGGALGAALLKIALKRKWIVQDFDSRVLEITSLGRREILTRFGLLV